MHETDKGDLCASRAAQKTVLIVTLGSCTQMSSFWERTRKEKRAKEVNQTWAFLHMIKWPPGYYFLSRSSYFGVITQYELFGSRGHLTFLKGSLSVWWFYAIFFRLPWMLRTVCEVSCGFLIQSYYETLQFLGEELNREIPQKPLSVFLKISLSLNIRPIFPDQPFKFWIETFFSSDDPFSLYVGTAFH